MTRRSQEEAGEATRPFVPRGGMPTNGKVTRSQKEAGEMTRPFFPRGGRQRERQSTTELKPPKGTVPGGLAKQREHGRHIHHGVYDIARVAAEVAHWRPRSWAMDGAHEIVQGKDSKGVKRGGERRRGMLHSLPIRISGQVLPVPSIAPSGPRWKHEADELLTRMPEHEDE